MVTVDDVTEALENVIDPELGLDFVELGLVYDIEIEGDKVDITFTLTSPGCPLGAVIDGQIQDVLVDLPGIKKVTNKLTFSPPWDPRTMASDDVKMQLGIW